MNNFKNKSALVIGSSRGMGKAIADEIKSLGIKTTTTSKQDLDTADIAAMERFAQTCGPVDVLVLNTGGPEKKTFDQTKIAEWEQAHRQLFLGFVALLRTIKLADNSYIFAITSSVAKEPKSQLALSAPYRVALTSLLKILSRDLAVRGISVVCIAPDQIATDRLKTLVTDTLELADKHPMRRLGKPEEIGKFIRGIVENDIKYLNGVTITFDGGLSQSLF